MKEKRDILEEDDIEIEDTEDVSIADISKPFDPKKIDITTKQMILDALFKRLRNGEINLNTSFQRGIDLWNKTKQSRLIESILIRLPLPAFYFDGSDDNNWLIVDGLQRICTFKNYIIDGNSKLQNLEYLTNFNDFSFTKLPRELQRRIEEHEITVYIINPGTPIEVKFNLFRRINTGGLTLTAQEIRHAINQGIPADFVIKLAELEEFKKYNITPKRMLDRDFVTRFIAFYIHKPEEYEPDLDTFLNNSMTKLKEFTEQQRQQILFDFQKALLAAWNIFGDHAFRKIYKVEDKKNPMNKALFDAWTTTLAKLDNDKIKNLIARKQAINQEFINLLNTNEDFEKAISAATGDKNRIEKRFKTIETLIKKVLI